MAMTHYFYSFILLCLLLVKTGLFVLGSTDGSVWNDYRLSRPKLFGGEYSYIKVSPDSGGGPPLAKNSWFGYSACNIGDLNEDGVDDLVVGAYGESYFSAHKTTLSKAAGAIYVLFMTKNFTVHSYTRISGERGGNTPNPDMAPLISFVNNDNFGFTVANIGDLDGDG